MSLTKYTESAVSNGLFANMNKTTPNMVQKTYIQTLRASFAPRTLAEIGRKLNMQ